MPSELFARMGQLLDIIRLHHMWYPLHSLLVQLSLHYCLSNPSFITLFGRKPLVLLKRVGLGGSHTAGEATVHLTTLANRLSELLEGRDSGLPVNAGIGDADALLERRGTLSGNLLIALVDVGLDHDTNDGLLALADLVGNDLGNLGLVAVVLVGVAWSLSVTVGMCKCQGCGRLTVRAVDHDSELLALLDESLLRSLNVLLVVVGALGATAKDNETVLVALGAGDSGQALLGNAHEVVFSRGSANGINSNTEVSVGSVLETDRERETRGKLAVKLAFGSTGADSTNRDEVGKELRGDGVQHLRSNRHTGGGQIAEKLSGDTKTLVDLERRVDIGIVDETLPADGRARLLKVGSHHNNEVVLQLLGKSLEPAAVLESCGRIVKGAGANNDKETVIFAHDDTYGLLPALNNSLESGIRHGNLGNEKSRRDEGILSLDWKTKIVLVTVLGICSK